VGYVDQYMDIRKYFTKDYYPLTPASTSNAKNLAMQYNDPQEGSGIVLAFRREDSGISKIITSLNGLDSNARYNVWDIDTGKTTTILGSKLMNLGLTITIDEQPGAVILKYTKV
jgi:alpha-galactosidase